MLLECKENLRILLNLWKSSTSELLRFLWWKIENLLNYLPTSLQVRQHRPSLDYAYVQLWSILCLCELPIQSSLLVTTIKHSNVLSSTLICFCGEKNVNSMRKTLFFMTKSLEGKNLHFLSSIFILSSRERSTLLCNNQLWWCSDEIQFNDIENKMNCKARHHSEFRKVKENSQRVREKDFFIFLLIFP